MSRDDDRTERPDAASELADAAGLLGSKPGSKLPPEAQHAIELARIQNLVVAAIAGCSWGKNMSTAMRRAYADYCRRYDVDPVTEMDNLGGSIYVNADWFKRKMGELRIAGVISDYWLEHIHADKRLDALRKDQSIPEELRAIAQQKWFGMLMKRIAHNVDEDAEAACLCTIVLATGGTPIVGCKWAGNGTSVQQPRGSGGSAPNPIAENNAVLYVESTSMRRAAIQLFSHLSGQRLAVPALPNPDTMDDELDAMGATVRESAERSEAAGQDGPPRAPQLIHSGYDEAAAFQSAFAQMKRTEGEPITVEVSGPPKRNDAMLRQLATMTDPYEEPNAVTLPDAPVNPCPVDREAPTPFDPDGDGDPDALRVLAAGRESATIDNTAAPVAAIGVDFALESEAEYPEVARKRCFKCHQFVIGPNTIEHDPKCPYYYKPLTTQPA